MIYTATASGKRRKLNPEDVERKRMVGTILIKNPYCANTALTCREASRALPDLKESYISCKQNAMQETLTNYIAQDIAAEAEITAAEQEQGQFFTFANLFSRPTSPDFRDIVQKMNDKDLDFDNKFLSTALERPHFLNTLLTQSATTPELMTEERKDLTLKKMEETQNNPDLAQEYMTFFRNSETRRYAGNLRLTQTDIQRINQFIPPMSHIAP